MNEEMLINNLLNEFFDRTTDFVMEFMEKNRMVRFGKFSLKNGDLYYGKVPYNDMPYWDAHDAIEEFYTMAGINELN